MNKTKQTVRAMTSRPQARTYAKLRTDSRALLRSVTVALVVTVALGMDAPLRMPEVTTDGWQIIHPHRVGRAYYNQFLSTLPQPDQPAPTVFVRGEERTLEYPPSMGARPGTRYLLAGTESGPGVVCQAAVGRNDYMVLQDDYSAPQLASVVNGRFVLMQDEDDRLSTLSTVCQPSSPPSEASSSGEWSSLVEQDEQTKYTSDEHALTDAIGGEYSRRTYDNRKRDYETWRNANLAAARRFYQRGAEFMEPGKSELVFEHRMDARKRAHQDDLKQHVALESSESRMSALKWKHQLELQQHVQCEDAHSRQAAMDWEQQLSR